MSALLWHMDSVAFFSDCVVCCQYLVVHSFVFSAEEPFVVGLYNSMASHVCCLAHERCKLAYRLMFCGDLLSLASAIA